MDIKHFTVLGKSRKKQITKMTITTAEMFPHEKKIYQSFSGDVYINMNTVSHRGFQGSQRKGSEQWIKRKFSVNAHTIERLAFSYVRTEEFDIKALVIEPEAFREARYKKIILAEGLETIKRGAFSYSRDVAEVSLIIPDSVKLIYTEAFRYSQFKSLSLPPLAYKDRALDGIMAKEVEFRGNSGEARNCTYIRANALQVQGCVNKIVLHDPLTHIDPNGICVHTSIQEAKTPLEIILNEEIEFNPNQIKIVDKDNPRTVIVSRANNRLECML